MNLIAFQRSSGMIKQNILAVISIVILLINYGKSARNYLLNLS